MSKLIPLSLAAICAVLVVALVYVGLAPIHPVVVNANARHISFAAPRLLTPPPEDGFAVIDERPVFNPARTPVPDATQPGTTSGSPSDLLLVGVILAPERSIALLKDRATSQTTSAVPGTVVDGWRVDAIEDTHVTISSASGRFTLPLSNPIAGGGPPPSTAPQQPANVAATAGPPTSTVSPATPPAPPVATATSSATPPPTKGAGKPALLVPTAHGNVAAEALKGAPIDPSTGEPTL